MAIEPIASIYGAGVQADAVKLRYEVPIEVGAGGAVPTEFRMFRAGINPSDKGDFLFDDEAARSVMAAFARKGTPPTMDYEHMAASDPPVIAPASASSWVPEVRLTAGGPELWATQINWTERAATFIRNREYTRFSPLFFRDPKTSRVLRVINCALTNVEALDNITPLVAATATQGARVMAKPMACTKCRVGLRAPTDDNDGDPVMCTACGGMPKALSAVGLRVDMQETEALAALASMASFQRAVLSLTAGSVSEAIGTIAAWKARDAEVVQLRQQLAEEGDKRLRVEFDRILDEAATAGKVPKAEREGLVKLALGAGGKVTAEAIETLRAYVATRSPVVAASGAGAGTAGAAAGGLTPPELAPVALQEADLVAARILGHDPAQVLDWKKKVHAALAGTATTAPGTRT